MFELAAFVRSKSRSEQKLVLQPTFIGPACLATFVTAFAIAAPITFLPSWNRNRIAIVYGALILLGSVAGYVAILTLRKYFRSIGMLAKKLSSISFESTQCYCCDMDHKLDGKTILCDREVVQACVVAWFGSQMAFEACIKTELLETVMFDLQHGALTKRGTLAAPWNRLVNCSISLDIQGTTANIC